MSSMTTVYPRSVKSMVHPVVYGQPELGPVKKTAIHNQAFHESLYLRTLISPLSTDESIFHRSFLWIFIINLSWFHNPVDKTRGHAKLFYGLLWITLDERYTLECQSQSISAYRG